MSPLDLSTDPRVRRVRKRSIPVPVNFAKSSGTLETLEGQVHYEAGDALLTGAKGECWPVQRDRFLDRYTPLPGTSHGKDGSYVRRPQVVLAVRVREEEAPLEVTTSSGGLLRANAGDWLVQYAQGDFGVLPPGIFEETYELVR